MKVPAGAQLIATGSTESESLGAWRLGDKVHVAGYHFGPSGDVIFSIPESSRSKKIERAFNKIAKIADAWNYGPFGQEIDQAALTAIVRIVNAAPRRRPPRPPYTGGDK